MKQVITLIILALISAFGMASANAAKLCPTPIFYAQSKNHTKEVSVCAASAETLYYGFGKLNKDPELIVKITKENGTWAEAHNSVISLSVLNISNGNTSYSIDTGTNDEGTPFSNIIVYQNGERLTSIALDPKTVINNISALVETTIPETDEL